MAKASGKTRNSAPTRVQAVTERECITLRYKKSGIDRMRYTAVESICAPMV